MIIATATVPDTTVVISVKMHAGQFLATREANGATLVNDLVISKDTEVEAREAANFLWTDTVNRRNSFTQFMNVDLPKLV